VNGEALKLVWNGDFEASNKRVNDDENVTNKKMKN